MTLCFSAAKRQKELKMNSLQIVCTFVVLYLIVMSGAQPVHRGIHQRQRRQDKLRTQAPSSPRSRLCNHTSGHTSTSDVSLLYKNGWFLAVYDDGNINGTSNARSPDIKLQLRSVGSSQVRIYSKRTCLYVAMSSMGKVYTTEKPNDETVFEQTHEPNGFQTFASHKPHYIPVEKNMRRLLFLSLRKTGHMKNGMRTSRNHRTTLLSVMPERETF